MKKELKTLTVLFKAYQSIVDVVQASIADSNINLNEFAALEALYHKTSLTTKELASSVLIPNSSMTYVVSQLEKKGYIVRQQDHVDKRIFRLELSAYGKEQFASIYQIHEAYVRPIFDVLDQQEEIQLQEVLKRIGKTAERKVNDDLHD